MCSNSRYIIFTGNVWREGPITDEQPTLDILFREMSSGTEPTQLIERPETSSDDAIIQTAQKAKNADKFIALWNGNWDGYASQSEADLALMGILCFYSKSNEQCRRLFLRSGLGARKKAKRTGYLDRMLLKIRASEPPVIDIDQLIKASNHEPENRNTTGPNRSTAILSSRLDSWANWLPISIHPRFARFVRSPLLRLSRSPPALLAAATI